MRVNIRFKKWRLFTWIFGDILMGFFIGLGTYHEYMLGKIYGVIYLLSFLIAFAITSYRQCQELNYKLIEDYEEVMIIGDSNE